MSAERNQDVAVIGSPSSNTELTLDLLLEATEERMVGALTAFRANQNGTPIISVGQVVGIELRNRWHEDSVFRNLVKRTARSPRSQIVRTPASPIWSSAQRFVRAAAATSRRCWAWSRPPAHASSASIKRC